MDTSKLAIAAILAIVLSIPASGRAQPSTSKGSDQLNYAALAQAVDRLELKLKKLRSKIDQTRFDPEELLLDLEFDAEQILSFMQEQISFQPYEGLLRGTVGTLRARAGNSLDQSLLLAYLLKSAGLDARIVRADLEPADAQRLLAQTASAKLPNSLAYLEPELREQFSAAATLSSQQLEWSDSQMAKQARQASDELLQQMEASGFKFNQQNPAVDWLTIVKAYFWVQHRSGPGEDWVDSHPAFRGEMQAMKLDPIEYFTEQVPDKYHHIFSISARLSQSVAGQSTTHQLMKPYVRPVANLDGIAFSYRNHPLGLNPKTMNDIEQALDNSQFLMPMFNGSRASGAQAFDLKGRIIDPMVLGGESSDAAGVFATVADKLEDAASNVADPDDPKALLQLESMWLEFVFTTPGGEETRYRRYLIPPGQSAGSTPENLLWPLITEHVYMLNTGAQPLDYLADRYLASGIASTDIYKALAHKLLYPDEGTPVPETEVPQDFGPLAQYRFMDANPLATDDVVSFRAVPSLMGLRHGFRGPSTAFTGVDVVQNELVHVQLSDDGLVLNQSAAVRRGVWDTSVEAIPGRLQGVDSTSSANAVEIFRMAREQNIAIQVIKAEAPGELEKLKLKPEVEQFIKADLEQGFTILLPKTSPAGVSMTGWWRVHPVTGQTLGMTADGYGQDITEYAIDTMGIAFNLVQGLQALKDCDKQKNDVGKMCCLIAANINNVTGLGMGSVLGATAGAAGAAVFDIVNYGTQLATEAAFGEAQGLMPQAKLSCDKMQAAQW